MVSNQLFAILFCFLFDLTKCAILNGNVGIKNATLNVTYHGVVANGEEDIYVFHLTSHNFQNDTVRISVSSKNASDEAPVIFVTRLIGGVLSWSVPFISGEGTRYDHVSQTLCPALNKRTTHMTEKKIYLDISTANTIGLEYTFKAFIEPEFVLKRGKSEKTVVNPAESKYFVYTFQGDEERVLVKVESNSSICAKVIVQTSQCPETGSSMSDFKGVYASMTLKAGIPIERSRLPNDKFYVVIIVKDTDVECLFQKGTINPFAPSNQNKLFQDDGSFGTINERSKSFVVTIERSPNIDEYVMAVLTPVIFFGSFYVIAFVVLVMSWCFAEDGGKSFYAYLFPSKVKKEDNVDDEDGEREQLLNSPLHSRHSSYGTDNGIVPINDCEPPDSHPEQSPDIADDYDWLDDIDKHKDVYRLKTNLTVADLSRKPYKKLNKKFNVYYWNILTVAVFYALPVIQLVLTYQRVVNASGDQDICYYNNFCMRPYHLLSAFNNVYSNIGYMMLGLLFIFLVMRRDRLARQKLAKNAENAEKYGIPNHYGILYAMGYALFMEGVMSACYHVCPNYSNFQFDTAFMYMIGILGCLRLYQKRHHDVFINAHFAYAGFAAVIFIAVLGVIFRSREFWVVFLICHVFTCFYLSCQIYYMGRVRTAIRLNWLSSRRQNLCTKPVYPIRLILLLVFNAINWALSINGIINIPRDFATYLLGIIICNGLLYVTFYGIMKLWNSERIQLLPFLCVMASLITWGVSISFFIKGLTDWQLSPAESREGNKACRLVNFYDDHDLWHFLSATAMFFSFMGVLTVDDDLQTVARSNINVF